VAIMADFRRILQLDSEGVSQRGIAEALSCSRNTVSAALGAARSKGIAFEEVASFDSSEIRHLLFPEPEAKPTQFAKPDFELVHKELQRSGVTLQMLWNEYATDCREKGGLPYRYSYYCELYNKWADVTRATLRIPRKPAEQIEVDWAGDTMEVVEFGSGEIVPAYIFVAVLTYSAYCYVEAFPNMVLASWIDAHIHAFEFFGGTARLLIPDNLKTGVKHPDRYEPAINPSYAQMAEHYATTVIPARVKAPKDKPVAEGSVSAIAYTIMGVLRNRRFFSFIELNEAIQEQCERLNAKPFQKREDSRLIVFLRDEKELLNPLPVFPFELSERKVAKVAPNYHVQVYGCFYSVPHRLIGKSLDVRITTRMVEIFDGSMRVASHARLVDKTGRYQTVIDHMPKGHREYLCDWTPERFITWASEVGPKTKEAIKVILDSKKIVEQTYRSCHGVMSLIRKDGGRRRLEWACERALSIGPSVSYQQVKRIWTSFSEKDLKTDPPSLEDKGYVRGSDYYDNRKDGYGEDGGSGNGGQ
jgi:transposase